MVAEADVDLADIVGRNLRRLRTQRGYSLSRLAEASGVSRAMLGQIELGRSVPSIGVLWKVARALDVRFAAFTVDARADGASVIRAASAKILMSQDGTFASTALFPADVHRRVEFYRLRLAGGGIEAAPAHPVGTIENLVVQQGAIEIDVDDKRYWLATGDAILFEADVAHTYRNTAEEDAIMYLVIVYADVPASK
jgi:Predicted transcriptional regulators